MTGLEEIPICPYCGREAEYVDSARVYGGVSYGFIWKCPDWPRCNSYVGVHKGTKTPLGRMADKELRQAKQLAHSFFDPLWQRKRDKEQCSASVARNAAYDWLSGQMGIEVIDCHIGMFDVEQCQKVIEICKPYVKKST